ncbi:copper resistance protein CopC [Saccharopolyspora sp. ID03-671]|uniref:copper resistance protein CopC n=1 Tax=Saccharopolyspora sp. ID03-671 TaxID=3073066 RepID=UPI003872C686
MLCTIVALGIGAIQLPAAAHTSLAGSVPASGVALEHSPGTGRFRLSEPGSPSLLDVALTGQVQALPVAQQTSQRDNVATQPFPLLNNGSYALVHQVVHAGTQRATAPASFAAPASTAGPSAYSDNGSVAPLSRPHDESNYETGSFVWLVGGGALFTLLLAVAAVVVLFRGRDH